MWILTTMYSTSTWNEAPAGFLIEIDQDFVRALRAIGQAVLDVSMAYRTRISHVDLPISVYRYFILDRKAHGEEVCDLLGIDEPPNSIEGSYCAFNDCPLFLDAITEDDDVENLFNARLDGALLSFVSLSGDPELSTPEIYLSELEGNV